ncbi:MAG: hypothetical protein IRZ02_09370 [Acidothermus sp.]|nr:hypothetical protein [Acidothermus sp.]MCL6538245.1 hypothetical protein [Acidothermus sp.]
MTTSRCDDQPLLRRAAEGAPAERQGVAARLAQLRDLRVEPMPIVAGIAVSSVAASPRQPDPRLLGSLPPKVRLHKEQET